jgi:hypothetical protein
MTLLSIVQDAWQRLGIEDDTPSVVVGASDTSVKVLLALSVQEGKELAARAMWQRLTKVATITTTATQVQSGAIPADFSRMIPDTAWNYTEREPLLGPLSPSEWQQLEAGLVGPPDLHFRLRGNDFLLLPTPEAGVDIRFEYVSTYWVDTDGDGEGDAVTWSADTDTPLLDEEAMTRGLVWRWLKRNRLPFADEFAEYKVWVDQLIARDGVRKTLNMGGGRSDERGAKVPEGSWNL